MPGYGVTPAGFVPKPYAQILTDIQSAQLATMNPAIDLSPTGPQGQQNGIVANALAQLWQLLGVVFNSFNRSSVEGAGLDNLGDVTGVPREGGSYTQVLATLTFSGGTVGTTFAAGQLVANVSGTSSFAFANAQALTVTSTAMVGVLMQATVIGATSSVNPGTLTQITNPVSGWLTITNPAAQSQLGANAELDPNYAARQEIELGVQGSCNLPATISALIAAGASQQPPITLSVAATVNTTRINQPFGSLTLPPNTYAVVVYDTAGDGAPGTWVASGTGQQAIANAIWANKPAGNAPIGTTSVTITDTYLGSQIVQFSIPTPAPLYVSASIAVRSGFTFASVQAAVQTALIAASTAQTPAGGIPPNGQLTPGMTNSGTKILGPQLQAVIMAVPGVLDVYSLTFDFTASPVNTAPLFVAPTTVPTLTQANVANIVITNGGAP
jgi:hypothetical protein